MTERPSNITITSERGVTTLLLDRAEKRNALDGAMYRDLATALAAAAANPTTRVVVLTGGPSVFTAGNDLGDFVRIRQSGGDLAALDFLRELSGFPKPIVAAVAGWAVGIGVTMLLHCDFVYAAPSARFRTPFVDLGLCPEAASSVLLPATIGPRHANEMLVLGAEVDAARARDWGLVTDVVEDVVGHAARIAEQLAARAPGAVRTTKALIRRASRALIAETMAAEGEAFLARLHSEEAVEAVTATLGKRKPDFSRF